MTQFKAIKVYDPHGYAGFKIDDEIDYLYIKVIADIKKDIKKIKEKVGLEDE